MSVQRTARIAIIGAGLGGTALGGLLQRSNFNVKIYEQTPILSPLGAGIHFSPNVMKVLRRLGLEENLRDSGVRPANWLSREWDSGEVALDLPLGDAFEARYGAPYLTLHRGDMHAALLSSIAPGTVEFGKRLIGLDQTRSHIRLDFEDGSKVEADVVVGADGINSKVREILLGPERATYTGYIAHRSMFPISLLGGIDLPDCTKWWSPDRHLVVYFIKRARDQVYFVSGVPQAEWQSDSLSVAGDLEKFRADFDGFHTEVRRIVEACPAVTNWAILEREPLPLWSRGPIVLLGDACHPMMPHMGQGAAMAIEDAAMLSRCLNSVSDGDFEEAFKLYKTNRFSRTSRVQKTSQRNDWLRDRTADYDWVFDYDVFSVPLIPSTTIETKTGSGELDANR